MTNFPGGVVVVIPARMASTRLPEKPLLRRTGKYLVQHTYEQARKIRQATAVIVATDDVRVFDAVRGFGGEAVMTSPDCATGTDRVAEAVRDRAEDLVVNVQGDEPEFDVGDVEALADVMGRNPSLPLGTLAVVASEDERDRTSAVKVVLDCEGDALYFSRSRIPFHRDLRPDQEPLDPPVLRHVGIYAFRREAVGRFSRLAPTPLERAEKLEQLRALEHGWKIRVLVGRRAPAGIDTPEDYDAFVRRNSGAPERLAW
ncbi:MAG: 3-deoxy-manno-octulosonate cytidylyltransferase [Planctomycetes bacterium]|nr:3-deoxy-manno-octulosonate cytidylyltransferase [Planctomycetota bacterium]